jgi:hypothetical protein
MTDYYTPAAPPTHFYGYQQQNTYWINGYRMYLHGNYWYYVDYPNATPLKASRNYYRTGGSAGTLFKVFGTLLFFLGIGLMFGDGIGFILPGAFCVSIGIFAVAMTLVDSMRNHPTAWKVGATVAVAGYLLHKVTDDE